MSDHRPVNRLKSNAHVQSSATSQTSSEMPLKVTWHVVAAVDKKTKQKQLFVVGKRQPDMQRFARAKAIQASLQEDLPQVWMN